MIRYIVALILVLGVQLVPTAGAAVFDYQQFNGLFAEERNDKDFEASCVLQNTKPGMDSSAARAVKAACNLKSFPKKCRNLPSKHSCIVECEEANYFSRKFGECSVG